MTNGTCASDDTAYTCAIKVMWTNMKNITLAIFVLIFLVVIFANVATIGIDNYTINIKGPLHGTYGLIEVLRRAADAHVEEE